MRTSLPSSRPRFQLYRGTSWSSGTAATTTLPVDTFQPWSVGAYAQGNTVFISRPGQWYISAAVGYHPNTNTVHEVQMSVLVNGSSVLRQRYASPSIGVAIGWRVSVEGILTLKTGDALTATFYRGTPVDASGYNGAIETHLSGFRLDD